MLARKSLVFAVCVFSLLTIVTASSQADVLPVEGGWQIYYPTQTQNNYATLDNVQVQNGALGLSIGKDFRQPWISGFAPTLQLAFTKQEASAVSKIYITSELIVNHTGTDWHGFKWSLGTPVSHPAFAQFDIAQTNANFAYTDFTSDSVGLTEITVDGGVVVDNSDFAISPGIWIDVSNANVGDTFFLWETPVTPEPATMSLLAIGGISMLIRRRRNRK